MPDLTTSGTLLAVLSLIFGLFNCFAGYRIFRALLGLYGLIFGIIVGATLAANVTGGEMLWVIVGAVIGGLVGSALFVLLYFVAVFFVGAVGGVSIAAFIGGLLSMEMPWLVVVILAIVVGIVALLVQRTILILVTAFYGAWLAVSGAAALITGTEPAFMNVFQRTIEGEGDTYSLLVLGAWVVLSVAGTVVQLATTREEMADATLA